MSRPNVLTCLERLSWREGQVVCESLGGYLAEIVSQEQQTLMVRSDVIRDVTSIYRKVLPC